MFTTLETEVFALDSTSGFAGSKTTTAACFPADNASASCKDEGTQSSDFVRPLALHIVPQCTVASGGWSAGSGPHFTQVALWLLPSATLGSREPALGWGCVGGLHLPWTSTGLFLWYCCCGFRNGPWQRTASGWHFSVMSTWQLTPAIKVKWIQGTLLS